MNFPESGPVVGVVGGGQLARMMAPEATALGITLRILAESPEACAAAAVPEALTGDGTDLEALRRFAEGLDALTFDHEHVPGTHLHTLEEQGVCVRPGAAALLHAQDKIEMRRAVRRLGLPNPRWAEVRAVAELQAFGEQHGWPVVLKTPRGGYDGKGVMVLEAAQADSEEVQAWFSRAAASGVDEGALLAEEKVPFTRELSALVARRPSGQARAWDVVESVQVDSVCDEVIAPAPELDPAVARAAQEAALRLAQELGVTGVMAVELFEVPGTAQGFQVNELAMRPHNSGHWTQDGSRTSQFEQHLRAVLDLPLGDTGRLAEWTVMKNVLGGQNPNLFAALPEAMQACPEAKVHLYGKGVRPGRKVGHVNATGSGQSLEQVRTVARRAAQTIRDGHLPA